jgi:hypothetical protein
MGDISISVYGENDRRAVIDLWIACEVTRPWNDPDIDIDRKQAMQGEWFFLAKAGDRVVGTVMFGYDGHRGSVNYLAIHPDFQK